MEENKKIEVFSTRVFKNSHEAIGQMVVAEGENVLFKCSTLELPWRGNMQSVSCIYSGTFRCVKVPQTSNIPYPHIWIKDVYNREGIKIHIVNYARQLRGCIGVGEKHLDIDKDGQLDITNSRKTFEKLMAALPDTFNITVR